LTWPGACETKPLGFPCILMDNDSRPTIWEHAQSRGISRREFLGVCTTMAAMLGLPASAVSEVVKALETKPRIPVIWFHFQECTCCSESFIRSSHPLIADILLDKISLDYTETLMAASRRRKCCTRRCQNTRDSI